MQTGVVVRACCRVGDRSDTVPEDNIGSQVRIADFVVVEIACVSDSDD